MSVRDSKRRQRGKEEPPKVDPSNDVADDVIKDIVKGRTDEQERFQQKVFGRWINSRFAKANSPLRVDDLFQDFRTGVTLAALVELITGIKVPVEKGRTRFACASNISSALEVLQNEIKLVSVSTEDIEEGNTKLTLSLTWSIVQYYYVKRLGSTVSDLRINNLEKTLLCWCQLATKGYAHVDVKNLHTSWTDGLAFNAVIHKYREDLFEYGDQLSNTAEVNLRHAFDLAAEHLDVPRLLEPEDLLQNYVDQKSIVIYLLCLLESLPHESMEMNAVTSVSQLESNPAAGDAESGRTYNSSAEAVLAWMLAAEEKLDRNEISESLEETTQLWNDHETFLVEISMQESVVQKVLDHGAKLLLRTKSQPKQSAEVENSLTLLMERWENLRTKATERSQLLQRMTSVLQQEHLKEVDSWLQDTEKRINSLKANTTSIESMDAQLRELSKLQDDLEKQLLVMNKLLHVLFVGDLSENEVLESNLMGFRQRWDEICHWTESQWAFVQRIRNTYDAFSKLCAACGEWIAGRIELLQGLPRLADERLQWVQRNLDMLQELHDQMADQQESIQDLQEKSEVLLGYFTPQTAVGMQIRHREEKISADWNILVDLLEVLTTDVNLRFDKADELRTSKLRQSKRYSDHVDTATVLTQSSEETEPRTKKARQEEEDEGVLENCNVLIDWLEEQNELLAEQENGGSSLANQLIADDIRAKEPEYNSLRMLAEAVITEKREMNLPCEEVENKLNELAAAWSRVAGYADVNNDLQMKDDDLNLNHNLEVLSDVLISCQSTVDRLTTDKDPLPGRIEQDLNDCKDRLHLMEINSERVKETAALVEKVGNDLRTSSAGAESMESSWAEIAKRWQSARQSLVELDRRLTNFKENYPVRTFLAETESLLAWTNGIHQSLMEEPPLRPTYLDRMDERLQHYQNVQNAVNQHQQSLELANSPPKQLVEKLSGTNYQMNLLDLNAKWKDILQYLQHNTEEITKWIENLRDFQVDVEGLKQWMADVNSFLDVDTESVHDAQAFVALQDQFRGLEEDIKALSPTTEKLLEAGRLFLRSSHEDFVEDMRGILQDVEVQWSSTCARAFRQLQVVPVVAAQRNVMVGSPAKGDGKMAPLTDRVNSIRNDMANIENLNDLRRLAHETKDAVKTGQSYLAPAAGKTLTDSELAVVDERLEELRACSDTLDRHRNMWAELSGSLKEAEDWVVVAEKKASDVEKSLNDTQRRKQLQELTAYMGAQNTDKYVSIADLAEQFTTAGVLVPLVRTEVDKMRQRLSSLSKQVSDLQHLNAADGTDSRSEDVSSADIGGQSPLFESLEPVNQLLNDLQRKLPLMELKQFDSATIKGQLEDCVMLYKKLSEIKAEVESLIKQGREVVESDPTKPENDSLSRKLDSMKTQYNQLGAQVTAAKAELDNGFKLVKKAEKELDALRIAMDEMEAALAELDKISDQLEYESTVEDIKSAVKEREETLNNLRTSHQQMRELAMKSNVPGFEQKYSAQMQRWTKVQAHLRSLKTIEKNKVNKPMSVAREAFFSEMKTVSAVSVGSVKTLESSSITTETSHLKQDRDPEDKQRFDKKLQKVTSPHLKPLAENVRTEEQIEAILQLDGHLQQLDTATVDLERKLNGLLSEPLNSKQVDAKLQAVERISCDLKVCDDDRQKVVGDLNKLKTEHRGSPAVAHLVSLVQDTNQRMTELHDRTNESRKILKDLQSFHKLLDEDLLVWLPKAEAVSVELTTSSKSGTFSNERYRRLVEERDSRIPQFDAAVQAANDILLLKQGPTEITVKRELANLTLRWDNLNTAISGIKETQIEDGLDVESYMASLLEAEKWVMRKKDELMTMRPSGDRAFLGKLQDYHHLFRAQLEREKPSIDSLLARGKTLEQQLAFDSRNSAHGNTTMGDLSEKLKSLSASWQSLFQQSDALQVETEAVTEELERLLKLCDTAREKLDDLHGDSNKWELPDDVNIEELPKKIEDSKKFKTKVDAQAVRLEEVNSLAARIQRTHAGLSEEVVRSVAHLNERRQELHEKVDSRLEKLLSATDDVTSSDNQHFLATSVDEPWERRVGPNRTPYYINHSEQKTQWDHPRMTDLMSALLEVNNIRFSAYRTATKLRLMQRKLHLDLLPLNTASEIFDKCGLRAQNDTVLDCSQAVTCLMAIYSYVDAQHPNRINFSLSIDVCLNWLLNCHDPERTGQISVLTFKVSIVILCQGELNAKYRYLFRLISDANGFADQKRVGQLLYSCIHIPRFLGEVAAFGGTDPQPSIDSCFKFSKTNGLNIQQKEFLAWLNREPQAVVWLSVLHRLVAAEGSRHPAKCNACRQFPIIGLRYRCLKCFNFDLCQNCFFTGQRSKNHKISHPMQEYCFPATSGEDMRDFKRVLKNKLRSRESLTGSSKSLGYLPVQPTSARSSDYEKSATLTSLAAKGSIGSNDAADFTQSRIVEFEGSRGASSPEADEEHNLIARYSNTLAAPAHDFTQMPDQILRAVDKEEKEEMEEYLRQLQDDHDKLIVELESVKQLHDEIPADNLLAEASMLRDDRGRLEARMKVLQDHNQQLDSQLQRIKHLLEETPERVPASPVPSTYSNGRTTPADNQMIKGSSSVTNGSSPLPTKKSARQETYSVGQLFHAAGSLNVAVGSLVTVMNDEEQAALQKSSAISGN